MARALTLLPLAAALLLGAGSPLAGAPTDGETVPLDGPRDADDDRVLEALLAPGEFPRRRFTFDVAGDEALFALDLSLGASPPVARVDPARIAWPRVAGLPLGLEGGAIELVPAREGLVDAELDAGVTVRFTLSPVGQRFDPAPRFAVRPEAVEVVSAGDGRVLLRWRRAPAPSPCGRPTAAGGPDCDVAGIGREARAAALSPDGERLALAIGGLQPRVEVWILDRNPRILWRTQFPPRGGGPVEVAFSADGSYLAVLTGAGRLHRFDAVTGGGHLAIPSSGRAARSVPPGHVVAVAGDGGEVTLWTLDDGTVAWRLPPRKVRGPVARLAASGDGRRLATLEYDEAGTAVRVWAVEERALAAQIAVEPYQVADIALDGAGARLFVSHERDGLLLADLGGGGAPRKAGGEAGARCRGRLEWIPGRGALLCAAGSDLLEFDERLGLTRTRAAGADAAGLILAAAAGSSRLAAVGAGRLLLWREDPR
jgi:hypothetical protein